MHPKNNCKLSTQRSTVDQFSLHLNRKSIVRHHSHSTQNQTFFVRSAPRLHSTWRSAFSSSISFISCRHFHNSLEYFRFDEEKWNVKRTKEDIITMRLLNYNNNKNSCLRLSDWISFLFQLTLYVSGLSSSHTHNFRASPSLYLEHVIAFNSQPRKNRKQ